MANPFDQFDESSSGNPFDKFDSPQLDISVRGLMNGPATNAVKGVGETVLSTLAGVPSQIAGGLYGLGTLLSGQGLENAAGATERIQRENFGLGSYAPQTEVGKAGTKMVQDVMEYPGKKAGEFGGYVGKKLGNEALGEITAKLPVDTLMNFLPFGAVVGGAKMATKGTAGTANKLVDRFNKPKEEPVPRQSFADIVAEAKQAQNIDTGRLDINLDDGPSTPPVLQAGRDGVFDPRNGAEGYRQAAMAKAEADRRAGMTNEANQFDLFDQPEMGRVANPYEAKLGDWRVDENGIPIKADLSMEVQNLQEPLQRNLWGDELSQTRNPIGQSATLLDENGMQQGRPLTEAIDSMESGARSATIDSELKGAVEPSGALEGAILEATPGRIRNSGRGPARGAIDARLFDDLYQWGKSVVSTAGDLKDRATLPGASELELDPNYVRPKDTIENPRSPETIAAKQTLARKADVAGLKGTSYQRVNTKEEVMADPGPDLLKSYTGARDALQSGTEGTLHANPKSAGVNFVRTKIQEARNTAETWSKKFLTDNKTGLNAQLNKLNPKQKDDVAGLLMELGRQGVPLSEAVMDKARFTPDQKKTANQIREALDHLYAEKTKALGEQGFDAHMYRTGYVPNNFSGAYKTLVGYMDKGEFKITGLAQADTAIGHKKALQWYKDQKDPKFGTEIKLGRRGLNTQAKSSMYDGWADLVQELKKNDPEFAKSLAAAEQRGAEAVASLYEYNVHELMKKGVTGSLGDRPWLNTHTNTRQWIEGLVDYLEQGYRYTAYQGPLNDVMGLVRDPEYRSSHPNTVTYLDKYVKHITGTNLNPIGAGVNFAIDQALRIVGIGNNKFSKAVQNLTQASTLHMMGTFNPGFFLAQLTQFATGGLPEALALKNALQIDLTQLTDSYQKAMFDVPALSLQDTHGKSVRNVEPHMVEAYKWAKEKGMFTFSEAALAHQVLQSKARRKIEPWLDAPIRLGENATRPVVFMIYSDMFNKAGFKGEEAHLRAQAATDFAMVNYHPDERPMLYQSLGVLGQGMGALTTFKHNLVNQFFVRGQDSVKGKNLTAAAATAGIVYALYGVSGLPGYEEASSIAEKLTGKPMRELIMPDPRESTSAMDGLLSAKTGSDFQSRLSMSSVLPDSPLSAFPHISNFANIMDKGFQAGMNPDQGNLDQLKLALTPAGMKGFTEDAVFPDGQMKTKEGFNKYEEPRSEKEQLARKLIGVRPFNERMQDQRVYSNRVAEAKRQDKLKDAVMRHDRAFLSGDFDGREKAQADYEKNGGDTKTLMSQTRLADLVFKAYQSDEARRAGKPTGNVNSLQKYEEFTN